ncbi:MAG: ABC transporter ATP-binding protein [Thermoprotei archaeon]|nr:MAG: ABC transporter ATP-binding protein [Thermoprotei archaeon]
MMNYVVEVNGLVKEFNGKRVLNGVTFNVNKGEVFGLLGPNGAGKTTTIRVILGLLKPTSGSVLVFGYPPSNRYGRMLKSRIGTVLESDGLFPKLTAYENLEFYSKIYGVGDRKERDRRIREVLELVGLYEFRGLKIGYFSKGMRRRLALARALIHDPELLILDEPTLGMDAEAQMITRDVISKLPKERGTTVLYTSHNLNDAEKVCTRVAILMDGRIVVVDDVNKLVEKASKDVVEVLFTSEEDTIRAYEHLRDLGYTVVLNGGFKIVVEAASSRVIHDISRLNVKIEEVKKSRVTLEDVYLRVTKGVKSC